MSLDAELLFARMRMVDFLAGKGPTQWDTRDPERISQQLANGFRSYLRGNREPPSAVDTDWAFAIPDELPESAEGSIDRLPDNIAVAFSMVGQTALQYMRDLVPVRKFTGMGIKSAVTTHQERAKIRRAAAAVEDPVGRLASPEYLSVDGLAAIAAVYPELYADGVVRIGEAVSELKRPLRPREEAALGKLSGIAAKPLNVLQGADKSQAGQSQQGQRPRGRAPQEPDLKPASQRLTER
jgi:hypothetical protein